MKNINSLNNYINKMYNKIALIKEQVLKMI
jgi:hypothetical protein